MVLWRELLGEQLRSARVSQKRTLRDVASSANIALGYLSELERGRKEASSELLGAICGALNVQVSEVLASAAVEAQHRELAASVVRTLPVKSNKSDAVAA
jgi:transcriptional regulator with XRE-family HTH domain